VSTQIHTSGPILWFFAVSLFSASVQADEGHCLQLTAGPDKAESYDEYVASVESILSTLSDQISEDEQISQARLFCLIDRRVAYQRFHELISARAPCDKVRDLMVFGYSPRSVAIENEDLPEEVQEIIGLVPSYCALTEAAGDD
jgi:hypothetical protein